VILNLLSGPSTRPVADAFAQRQLQLQGAQVTSLISTKMLAAVDVTSTPLNAQAQLLISIKTLACAFADPRMLLLAHQDQRRYSTKNNANASASPRHKKPVWWQAALSTMSGILKSADVSAQNSPRIAQQATSLTLFSANAKTKVPV